MISKGLWVQPLLVLCAVGVMAKQQALADVYPNTFIGQGADNGSNRYNGVKRALYYVIHDTNDAFTTQEWDDRVAQIRVGEDFSRQFLSENSGGKFDFYFNTILDVPMQLVDGKRPGNWRNLAKDYAANALGFSSVSSLNSYFYANVFDVNQTNHPDGESFTGFYHGGNDISLHSINQSTTNPNTYGQRTQDHEIGHRISLGHAHAYRSLNNSTHSTYVWNDSTEQYETYEIGSSPFHATPYGMEQREYGNPFDQMGHGNEDPTLRFDFNVGSKRNLGWLTGSQVPNLDATGEGTYRIYAHDQLTSTAADNTSFGDNELIYGVSDGYNSSVDYGLTFSRTGERFNPSTGQFQADSQTMFIEYRAGQDGVAFLLDGVLLDLDPAGGTDDDSTARLLNIGDATEDIRFGMSNFAVTQNDIDFLSFNPPPPTPATTLRDAWFHFSVLGNGSDAIGDYIELQVTEVEKLNGIAGDLDQQNGVTSADLDLFIAGWRTDTSQMTSPDQYYHGDMNFDGITDLADAWLFHQALNDANAAAALFETLGVPEPSALLSTATALLALAASRRKRYLA